MHRHFFARNRRNRSNSTAFEFIATKPATNRNPRRKRCFYAGYLVNQATPCQSQPPPRSLLEYTIPISDGKAGVAFNNNAPACPPVREWGVSVKKHFEFRELMFLAIGSLMMAVAINLFIANHNFAFGGISGISVITNALWSVPLGITYWVLNLPLFLLSIKTNGLPFTVKSVIATSMVSFFLFTTAPLQQIPSHDTLAAVFGGVLMGLSVAVIFCGNGSTGGTTTAACILKERFNLPLRVSILIIDGGVVVTGAVIFGIDKAFYSIILLFCLAQTAEYGVKHLKTILDKIGSKLFRQQNVRPKQATNGV